VLLSLPVPRAAGPGVPRSRIHQLLPRARRPSRARRHASWRGGVRHL